MPRLPRKVARRPGRQIRTKRATQYHECHACHAKTMVDVSLCHACHVKRRWMSPSATPATQSGRGAPGDKSGPKRATQCHLSPRLPRKTKVDVRLCHACHVKRRWMSGCATPATQSGAAPRATNPDQARHTQYHECHACHTKRRWM